MSYAGYLLEEYFGIRESRSVNKYGVVYSKSNGDPRHTGKGFCGLKDRNDASIDAKATKRFAADHGFTKKGDMGQGRYLRAHLGKSSRAKDDLKLNEGGNAANRIKKKAIEIGVGGVCLADVPVSGHPDYYYPRTGSDSEKKRAFRRTFGK